MTVNTTTSWDSDVEFVEGADLRDKAELVGIEFKITGVRFEKSGRGIMSVICEAETRDGEEFDFYDSSTTGVKHQIETYLGNKDISIDYDNGALHPVSLLIPRGLRVSTYEVTDLRGKAKTAKTYYLTTAGRQQRQKTAA